jgi:hypothetical protein
MTDIVGGKDECPKHQHTHTHSIILSNPAEQALRPNDPFGIPMVQAPTPTLELHIVSAP